MSDDKKSLLQELKNRELIQDVSHFEELKNLIERESISYYCGFDPTGDSLHVGHMLPLIMMKRLQDQGHKPISLIGSATGMIGDPSGKSKERNLLSKEVLEKNVKCIEQQIKIFLKPEGENKFEIVYNHDWLGQFNYIDFLREVGRYFSVNSMLNKESVKQRLNNREQGISYTEFSYQLLQAYDFYHLNKEMNCKLQIGGSDQWGNITAGIDLIRRLNEGNDEKRESYGLTFPLLMTSSGTKFGKTENGAVWLDPKKTSPYQFYQYWVNTSDEDVIHFIKMFTETDDELLKNFINKIKSNPERREAQRYLALTLTSLVHGEEEGKKSEAASKALFNNSISELKSDTLIEMFKDVPSTSLKESELPLNILDILVQTKITKSKGEARRLIANGGLYLNDKRLEEQNTEITKNHFIDQKVLLVRNGKKKYHLITL